MCMYDSIIVECLCEQFHLLLGPYPYTVVIRLDFFQHQYYCELELTGCLSPRTPRFRIHTRAVCFKGGRGRSTVERLLFEHVLEQTYT